MLGKISTITGLSPVLTYHLARLLLGLLFLGVTYHFVATFLPAGKPRKLTFLLIALGSGLGWLVILSGWFQTIGLPIDIYVPESFSFLTLIHLPHLLFAETALLMGFLLWLQACRNTPSRWWLAIAAGLAFLLTLTIAAFYVAIIIAVIGLTLLLHLGHTRRIPWQKIILTALVLNMTLPVVIYNIWIFATIPAFQALGTQLLMRSPSPLHYLLAYGPLLMLALPGFKKSWQHQDLDDLFLIAWVIVTPLLVYLPFNLQRRLLMGVQLPLSILAVKGFFLLLQHKSHRYRQRSNLILLFFATLTNLFLLGGTVFTIWHKQPPLFQPTAQIEAMRWLAARSQGEVVIAAYDTGNLLPAYANVRAFVGHGPETLYSEDKQAQVKRFFSDTVDDTWRLNLLQQFKVRYLYYGPNEKALGDFFPDEALYLQEIYQKDGIQIFWVTF
jgi:hypothetical protein